MSRNTASKRAVQTPKAATVTTTLNRRFSITEGQAATVHRIAEILERTPGEVVTGFLDFLEGSSPQYTDAVEIADLVDCFEYTPSVERRVRRRLASMIRAEDWHNDLAKTERAAREVEKPGASPTVETSPRPESPTIAEQIAALEVEIKASIDCEKAHGGPSDGSVTDADAARHIFCLKAARVTLMAMNAVGVKPPLDRYELLLAKLNAGHPCNEVMQKLMEAAAAIGGSPARYQISTALAGVLAEARGECVRYPSGTYLVRLDAETDGIFRRFAENYDVDMGEALAAAAFGDAISTGYFEGSYRDEELINGHLEQIADVRKRLRAEALQ